MKLHKLLHDKYGENHFSRGDVFAIAEANDISSKVVRRFLGNSENKVSRGKYKVNYKAPKQETEEQITERINSRFNVMRIMTEACAKGKNRSLIVSGPPGLGKSYIVSEILSKYAPEHQVLSGHASAIGLYRALWATRLKGSVLVIDDCDSIFTDLVALNLLKSACDSSNRRIIRWSTDYDFGKKSQSADIPDNEIEYEGTVIFITNINFDVQLEKETKITPHIDALMSRSHYLSLGITNKAEYLVRIKQVLIEMLKTKELSNDEYGDVVTFLNENMNKIREFSVRTVIKLVQLRNSLPNDWYNVAKITLCK